MKEENFPLLFRLSVYFGLAGCEWGSSTWLICPADRWRPLQLWLWAWPLPMCIMNMPKLDLGGWIDGPHFISKSILFNWYRVCFAICKPKAFMSTLMQHGKLSLSFLLWRKWKWLSIPLFHIRSFITHWNCDNSLLASDCQSPVDVSDSWKCTPRGPQRGRRGYFSNEGLQAVQGGSLMRAPILRTAPLRSLLGTKNL